MNSGVAKSPQPIERGLGSQAAGGAVTTMFWQGVRVVIQFGGIVFLTRLLTPRDYGLVAMVTAISGFAEILRDFGLFSAAIQAKVISTEQRDNLFWWNTGIGGALTVGVLLVSPWIAQFYHEPVLVPITQIMSLTFLLNGMTTQYRAHLTRELQFGQLALSDVGAQSFGLMSGVVVAYLGFGYWALVVQQVAQAIVNLGIAGICSRWLPGRYHREVAMRDFLSYGGNLMCSQMLTYLSGNLAQIIIGWRMGANALGLYNRAYQLLMLPLNQINGPATTVALPILSKLQDDPVRFEQFLIRGQSILIHVTLAAFAFACAQAEPLIDLVLGHQWRLTAPLFQVLTLGGMFQVVAYASCWVFLAKGLIRAQLIYSFVSRLILIACIAIGAIWGLLPVCFGFSVGLLIVWPLTIVWMHRASGVAVSALVANGLRAMVGYSFCLLIAFLSHQWLQSTSNLAQLTIGALVMSIAFGVVFGCWPTFRRDIIDILLIRHLLTSNKARS